MTRIRATRRYVVVKNLMGDSDDEKDRFAFAEDVFEGTYKRCENFIAKSGIGVICTIEERDRNNIVIRIWDHTGKLRFKI